MPSTRTLSLALLGGIAHAAVLLAVATTLGYDVGPSAYTPIGVAWRYGGLVLVAALPIALALEYRLATPLVALCLTTAYVLGMELTPPGPTFRDVAELERLAEPTGVVVVENGLYIVRYMVDASVWSVGFLFLGSVEYVVRTTWIALPDVRRTMPWATIPASRRRAMAVATTGGLLHAVVMGWYAARLGVTVTSSSEWLLYVFGTVGMWLLAAIPLYLLVRHRLVVPVSLLTVFVLFDALAEFWASVEDPHALYFGGWFVYLGLVLVAAGLEYVLRRIEVFRRLRSSS